MSLSPAPPSSSKAFPAQSASSFHSGADQLFLPNCALELLYLSPHFAVIAKPAGMALYPSRNCDAGRTVESCLKPQKRGGSWLVHRLDYDTAGCLLIARRKQALIAAQDIFSGHKNSALIQKTYWAVLAGEIDPALGDQGVISLPLRKKRTAQNWSMEIAPHGAKEALTAQTKWRKLASGNGKTWVELTLLTGRTHQARLHCAYGLGTPVLGDPLYPRQVRTPALPKAQTLCLLARALSLSLPSGEKIFAEMAPPSFMQQHINMLCSNPPSTRL